MAFGAVRGAYKAPCKFFADDSVADNRIIWYYVPDGTPVYDGWTVFWPRVDVAPNQANSLYEKEGLGVAVRQHFLGMPGYGFPGTHVHGDDADFQGLTKRAKYFADGPPSAPCPTPAITVPLAFNVFVTDPVTPPPGCNCGSLEMPLEYDLEIVAPDYPEIDGLIVPMVEIGSVEVCEWQGSVVIGDSTLTVDLQCWIPFSGTEYVYVLTWTDSPYGFVSVSGGILVSELVTDPNGFSTTEEASEDFSPSGKMVTLRTPPVIAEGDELTVPLAFGITVADPSSDTIPIGLAFKLDVSDVDPALSVEVPLAIAIIVEDVP